MVIRATQDDLMRTLSSIEIDTIQSVSFQIQGGDSFLIQTDNIKRLAKYIIDTKKKSVFLPGELLEIFDFVSQNLVTNIPEDALHLITTKLSEFCQKWGSVRLIARELPPLLHRDITPTVKKWLKSIQPPSQNVKSYKKRIMILYGIALISLLPWLFIAFSTSIISLITWTVRTQEFSYLSLSILWYPRVVIGSMILSALISFFSWRLAYIVSWLPIVHYFVLSSLFLDRIGLSH